MVGIPGIEPGVGFPDGVTVRSRTLRGDAQLVYLIGNESRTHIVLLRCAVQYR